MEIIRPLQLAFLNRVMEHNRKFYFIASLSLGVNLRTGNPGLESDYLKDAFACMGERPLPDMGMPKPRGEFLVSGSFFPPEKKETVSGRVSVSVGHQDKDLLVFGPRKWRNRFPSKPAPMTSMPVDFGHAFGGKGCKKNPNGLGYEDGSLPCIENPKQLITSMDDRPDPAGFSALDPSWPQRMRFQGTYNDDYLEKYFPGYPEDFDWQYFLCAPEDQWNKGYYQCDERFEIHHMHPDIPVIKGKLPGLYARCFLNHVVNKKDERQFSELPLNLDTIWFFPEKLLALLIWRGVIEVADDEAERVTHVLAAYEDRAHPPRGQEHYREALERRITGNDPLLNYFNTEDLIPIGAICAMELLQREALVDDEESALSKNMNAKAKAIQKMADEKVEQAVQDTEKAMQGIDIPDEVKTHVPGDKEASMPGGNKTDIRKIVKDISKAKPDAEIEELKQNLDSILPGVTAGDPQKIQLKKFSFHKLDMLMDTLNELMEKKKKQAFEAAEPELERSKKQLKLQLESLKSQGGISELPEDESAKIKKTIMELEERIHILDRLDGETEQKTEAPLPRLNVKALKEQLSSVPPQVAEGMQHLESLKKMEVDDERTRDLEDRIQEILETQLKQVEDGLRRAEKNFRETYIIAAHFMEDGLSPHEEPLETVAERFLKAVADGEDVSDGDWACIDLSDQNLDGVDLRGAFLEQVNFTGARLKGANLSKAILARADLTNADLTGANLEGANAGGVNALRANFTDANLKSARLSKGDFTEAKFVRAELEDTETLEIVVNGADFTEAHMPLMKFIESELKGVIFSQADMTAAVFFDCDVSEADFSETVIQRSAWADVRLENIVFDGADMTSSCFAATDPGKSRMKNLRFSDACLHQCNFQNMVMQRADFSGASLENANFNGAGLAGADLSGAYARNAQFRKADLTRANLHKINLMEGSLAKARLSGASFIGANLYAVDFLRSIMGDTDFSGANLDATLIKDWRPS